MSKNWALAQLCFNLAWFLWYVPFFLTQFAPLHSHLQATALKLSWVCITSIHGPCMGIFLTSVFTGSIQIHGL